MFQRRQLVPIAKPVGRQYRGTHIGYDYLLWLGRWIRPGRLPRSRGIVARVENRRVYTIEGNSGDACKEKDYPVGYYEILGYGAPTYWFIVLTEKRKSNRYDCKHLRLSRNAIGMFTLVSSECKKLMTDWLCNRYWEKNERRPQIWNLKAAF